MGEPLKFDYYYGVEAEQFSFYRVPRLLIKDKRFKGLSSDAKLLYGLMLDRMALSMKNGWLDDKNRAYIIYMVENIMEDLGCAKATCVKVIKELDNDNGIGLIEKKRRGLGKPDIIYVKNFVAAEDKGPEETDVNTDKSAEVQNLNFNKSNNYTSESSEVEPQEVQKPDPSYIEYNYTDMIYNNHINQSERKTDNAPVHGKDDMTDLMDETNAYMKLICDNIEYEHYMKYDKDRHKEMYEEIYETICDVVCVKRKTIRINGDAYPYELVKSRFLKLTSSHVEYVIRCMKDTITKITNIRAYLITALYNAPSTMSHYYQQAVQHDMYGADGRKMELYSRLPFIRFISMPSGRKEYYRL
ncbi:MAG: replication initiator protein A [Lachnospiraceae bacterium]|nr:replication initiator protein A [Lachnospiraceae bacterium]